MTFMVGVTSRRTNPLVSIDPYIGQKKISKMPIDSKYGNAYPLPKRGSSTLIRM